MAAQTPAELAARLKGGSVSQGSSAGGPSVVKPVGIRISLWGSRMTYSRVIGSLFLLGFVSYGTGFGVVSSAVGPADFVSDIAAHPTLLVLGAFLMLLNSVVDVGKGVLFFPIVEPHGRRTALAYLATMIVEVVLLTIGVLCLLMIVPIGKLGLDTGAAQTLGSFLVQANAMAYQLAMMTMAIGNIPLWSLSYRVRLIPRWLSAWGVIGYVIFGTGAIAEVFGIPISLMASVPGGLFEVALGLWLIIKGFEPAAYGDASLRTSQ